MDLRKLEKYAGKSDFVKEIKRKTFDTEMKCHGCGQVIVHTFLEVFEEDNTPVSMASSPFAAGLALTGNNCGAVIGGLMVLGLVFGRKNVNEGMGGILAGIRPMRKLVKYFQETYKSPNCRDITGTDLADPEKAAAYFQSGGLERCASMMADVAGFVAEIIYGEMERRSEES
ncbi:MAG: C_GCAxxG_C_C family protein [Deltaproteobacteria bacterium]|nr:C_GCAxxG_C_C family protein [Deltaproteobacteria bacterium]MBW2110102.1 C_GCAxxG_C_C family protein [Deltaproteobacteria bacterium]